MPRVTVKRGDEVVVGFKLGDQPMTLVRGFEADIRTNDSRLSRKHCRLELCDRIPRVTDLKSTNGVYYKGPRVEQQALADYDEFYMGHLKVDVEPDKPQLGKPAVEGVEAPAGEAAVVGEDTRAQTFDLEAIM